MRKSGSSYSRSRIESKDENTVWRSDYDSHFFIPFFFCLYMYMKLEKDLCEYGNRKEFETDAQPRDSVSVLSGVRGEETNEQK